MLISVSAVVERIIKIRKFFSPLPKKNAGFIFLFHTVEVNKSMSPWTYGHRYITPFEKFKKQIRYIKKSFSIVPTSELIKRIKNNDWVGEKNIAAIHFDDGFYSYSDIAVPYLRSQKIPSTVFLVSDILQGDIPIRNKMAYCLNSDIRNMYLSEVNELLNTMDYNDIDVKNMSTPEILAWSKNNFVSELEQLTNSIFKSSWDSTNLKTPFMDSDSAIKLADDPDIEIGSHTISHSMLSILNRDQQRREILVGHDQIEKLLGKKLNFFAYPFGGVSHFNDDSRSIVNEKSGWTAFSTYGGINYIFNNTDMKRITLTDQSPSSLKLLILSNTI